MAVNGGATKLRPVCRHPPPLTVIPKGRERDSFSATPYSAAHLMSPSILHTAYMRITISLPEQLASRFRSGPEPER